MTSTGVVPANRSCAYPIRYGVLIVTAAFEKPGLTWSACLPPATSDTTQIVPCGPMAASLIVPKLGAVATLCGAVSGPPDDVVIAISSPSGPFSDAAVAYCQTSVTVCGPVSSTRRPKADESPSESTCETPPLQAWRRAAARRG